MGLDQYAYSKPSEDSEEQTELAYWRKHNRLQGWMEQLWEDKGRPNFDPKYHGGGIGDFNCIPVELNLSDIEQLEAHIENKSLPETAGFFFGNDSYDWGDHLGNSVQIGLNIVSVDIADTQDLRMTGLSNHEELELDRGMLFVYSEASPRGFWMKGMEFPIDIIWITEECKISNITENVPIPSMIAVNNEDYEIYTSGGPVEFVLEVNAGYVQDNQVFVGDTVIFLDELAVRYKC